MENRAKSRRRVTRKLPLPPAALHQVSMERCPMNLCNVIYKISNFSCTYTMFISLYSAWVQNQRGFRPTNILSLLWRHPSSSAKPAQAPRDAPLWSRQGAWYFGTAFWRKPVKLTCPTVLGQQLYYSRSTFVSLSAGDGGCRTTSATSDPQQPKSQPQSQRHFMFAATLNSCFQFFQLQPSREFTGAAHECVQRGWHHPPP